MSRSNNSFPSYVKLDINPARPKKGWDDGCRRCSECGKSWPNIASFSPSPCHNVTAGIVKTSPPDMTWPAAVKELLRAKFNKYYEQWNEGTSDEELYWTEESVPSEQEISEGMKEIEKLIACMEERNVG